MSSLRERVTSGSWQWTNAYPTVNVAYLRRSTGMLMMSQNCLFVWALVYTSVVRLRLDIPGLLSASDAVV